jgi:ABC-type uncharacterized transport system involved in gliding motility auxiliary subunit
MTTFAIVFAAVATLFMAGLRAPRPPGRRALLVRWGLVLGAAGVALVANMALYKHDTHYDLTREQAFTPAEETLAVVRALERDVDLVYFYQQQSPAGLAAKQMVELLGRTSPRLHVQTVDPDRNPGVANRLGVKLYNAAVLRSGGEQIEVITTEDREIALGIQRLLRKDRRPVCVLAGHGEYDVDNFEFHTHFEGRHSHSHDVQGMSLVQMELHGAGRLRRALEKLGYGVRKVTLGLEGAVPDACSCLVAMNPRTRLGPPDVQALEAWLVRGGSLLMLVEPDYAIDERLAALLARAGVKIEEGVVIDPTSHYYTDEQMIAIAAYADHPATRGLALSFFPGARPVSPRAAPGVTAKALFSSSASSMVVPAGQHMERARPGASPAAPRPLAVASQGSLDAPGNAKPFRLIVIGDADFASNSFFPYLANADLALGAIAWLRGEERGPAVKPPAETLPTVVLTNRQMQGIFVLCVLLLPGLVMLAGAATWWLRRR